MKKAATLCILTTSLLLSCAKLPQKSRDEGGIEIPEWFDTADSLRIAYLYSEGAKEVVQSGVPMSGLPYWDAILKIDSLHGGANYRMSELGVDTRPQKAFEYSRRAVASDSTNIDYLSQYAFTQVATGQYNAALQTYNSLLKKDSHNPYNYRMAAALYASKGMPHMAISLLDSAEYKLGRYEELAAFKRELLLRVKNFDRAISETQSVIANNPFDHTNFRVLGEIYAHTGQDSLALANFQRALELVPEDSETLISLGEFHLSRGNHTSYLEVLKKLFLLDSEPLKSKLELYDNITENIDFYRKNFYAINTLCSILHLKYPDSYEVTQRYATHLIRAGEIDKALKIYQQEITKEGAPLDAYISVIDIENYLGLRTEMFTHLDQAIAHYPSEGVLYLRKAFELQRNNEGSEREILNLYKKAVKVVEKAEDKSSMLGSLGDYYHSIGKAKECYREYTKALKYDPNNATVLNNWAYFLSEENRELDRALEMSVRACELTPSNPTYLDTQAWILHLLGRTAEAKKLMMQAISLDPSNDDTLLLHYAEILAADGSEFMAEMYYKRALEAGGDKEYINQRLEALKNKK